MRPFQKIFGSIDFFFQAEDGIRDYKVTGVQTCALPISEVMAKIDAFFNLMFEQKASDLHLSSGNAPMLRINGELQRVDFPPLENDGLKTMLDRKSTRLNSSHLVISYAVFCLKKKTKQKN